MVTLEMFKMIDKEFVKCHDEDYVNLDKAVEVAKDKFTNDGDFIYATFDDYKNQYVMKKDKVLQYAFPKDLSAKWRDTLYDIIIKDFRVSWKLSYWVEILDSYGETFLAYSLGDVCFSLDKRLEIALANEKAGKLSSIDEGTLRGMNRLGEVLQEMMDVSGYTFHKIRMDTSKLKKQKGRFTCKPSEEEEGSYDVFL